MYSSATPSDVEHAITAVAGLDPAQGCSAEAVGLAGAPPVERAEEVGEVRLALASIFAEYQLARLDALPERFAALQTHAESIGYPLLLAEIADARGQIASATGDFSSSAKAFEGAYVYAREAADPVMTSTHAAELASVLGASMGDVDDGARWLRVAELEQPKVHLPELALQLHTTRGGLLLAQGEFADALAAYDQAIATIDGDPRLPLELERPTVESNRAIALTGLGRLDDAIATVRRVVASNEALLGTDHPALTPELGVLAAALEGTGDYAAATEISRRAVALRERAFGPDSPSLAAPLAQLASALEPSAPGEARQTCQRALVLFERIDEQHRGVLTCTNLIALTWMAEKQHERAKRALLRTLTLTKAQLGEQHPGHAAVLNNLAFVEHRLGNLEAAESWVHDAVEILRTVNGGESQGLGPALSQLGTLQLERGDADAAIDTLEDAMRHLDGGFPPEVVGRTSFALAQAIVAASGDRAKAIELAERARVDFARAQPPDPDRVARVDAWLRDRP